MLDRYWALWLDERDEHKSPGFTAALLQVFSIWGVLLANQNSYYRNNQKEHRCVVIDFIKVWLRQEGEKKVEKVVEKAASAAVIWQGWSVCLVCVKLVLFFLVDEAFPSLSALVQRKRLWPADSSADWQRAVSGRMNAGARRHTGAAMPSQVFLTQGLGPCHLSDNSLI